MLNVHIKFSAVFVLAAFLVIGPAPAFSQNLLGFFRLPSGQSFGALAIGNGPRYMGAEETVTVPVPVAQFQSGPYTSRLVANYLAVDLVETDAWAAGPSGLLRFGRSRSNDPAVDSMQDISWTIDLGGHLHRQWNRSDYQRYGAVGGSVLFDMGNVHGGWTANANIMQFVPFGRFGTLGLAAGTHYGSGSFTQTYFGVSKADAALSGLPVYTPGGGLRDVYVASVLIQPVSPEWAVGAGFLYSKLMGASAESPIVAEQSQFYVGIGVMRVW